MEPEHSPNPQVSRGIYGFVMFLMFAGLILLYILWLLIPSEVMTTWTYEPPQKYWALAVPIFFCTVLFLFAFCIYPAMCSRHDGQLYESSAVTDNFAVPNSQESLRIPVYDLNSQVETSDVIEGTPCPSGIWKLYDDNAPRSRCNRAIPTASDLDIVEVSKVLYTYVQPE